MIIKEGTLLKISDNSGAKTAKCIKILGGYKKKTAQIGDLIVVSIQKTRNKTNNKKPLKITKKDIFKAIVVKTKFFINKKSRIKFKFKNNFIVLVDKQKNPIGTRITSFVTKKLKKINKKLLSIALKKFENIAKFGIALVCRIKACEFNPRYFRNFMFYKYYFLLHHQSSLKYEYCNKFYYSSIKKLPNINKIILSFDLKVFSLKIIGINFLILNYLVQNKKFGFFIKADKPNLILKIKKGNPIGCEFLLKKNKVILYFLNSLISEILLLTKINKKLIFNDFFRFKIDDILILPKLEKFFSILNLVKKSNFNILIYFNANQNEIKYLTSNLKIFVWING